MPFRRHALDLTVGQKPMMGCTGQCRRIERVLRAGVVPNIETLSPALFIIRIIDQTPKRFWLRGIRIVVDDKSDPLDAQARRPKAGEKAHAIEFRNRPAVRKKKR